MRHVLPAFLTLLMGAGAAEAQWWDSGETPGALVGVSIEVDGRRAPLYAAPDGSTRWYLEAREGSSYAVVLSNRTAERLGVVLTVDGLNAISGERDSNRMYVLGPWEQSTIRGWRTSLADVRRFTFVDERASYAARSGKANSKMGWIQAAIYRERRRYVRPWLEESWRSDERDRAGEAAPLPDMPPPAAPPATADAPSAKLEAPRERSRAYPGGGSFPGTGWGPTAEDPAVVVSYDPEPTPADRISLRYEYRSGLVALGVLPRPWPPRDRLRERDRGDGAFAKAPAW
jgi:hypothetical protein